MADKPETDLEAEEGELLPDREVMSVIGTDPSDALLLPGEEFSIQPIEDPADDDIRKRPIEPPGV